MSQPDSICSQDMDILEWNQSQTPPSQALVRPCCRERGYLYTRQNPRGFQEGPS
jgi:hypothetical protein